MVQGINFPTNMILVTCPTPPFSKTIFFKQNFKLFFFTLYLINKRKLFIVGRHLLHDLVLVVQGHLPFLPVVGVVPDNPAGYPAFFDIRYPAGYPVSFAGYPAGRITGYPVKLLSK